jgi:hypothetical protein
MAINSDNPLTTTNFNIQPVLWNLTLPSPDIFDDSSSDIYSQTTATYNMFTFEQSAK